MKEIIIQLLKEALREEKIKYSEEQIENLLEVPPKPELGDFAFPCFSLSKELKLAPDLIANELRSNIPIDDEEGFESIETKGPYINFFLDRKAISQILMQKIHDKKNSFGKNILGEKKKTLVEFPSPNTNKPLHLGHLRNMAIGESVSRILEFSSEDVIRANLNNDRGVHICKSMLAYKKWGKNKKPSKKLKSDHLVGDFYVLFAKKAKENPKLEKEAQDMLLLWEQGDKETVKLWAKMNLWALEGFKETFKRFGIIHNKEYFESQLYTKGKEIIEEGIKKKTFIKEEDGAVSIDLTKEGLGKKYLLRGDGTSIYITQDLYLAKLKFDEFNINKSIYVVGNEQDYHFQVLFNILDKLKVLKKENLFHLSYGMVNLPEGKMKSREGTVVDADDLINKVQDLVKKELIKRDKLTKAKLEKKSLVIALAAIKYLLLKVDIKKEMIFNPKESISFEGDTGPYLLYSYARAKSILKKVKNSYSYETKEELEEKEEELIVKLSQFEKIVESTYTSMNPSLIARYSYELSQIFNEFYHSCPVIGSKEKEQFRISLVESFSQVLRNGLYLLGIDVLEEM